MDTAVTIRSVITNNDPNFLLQEAAFSGYLRLIGWEARLELQPHYALEEFDTVTSLGIRVNLGEYVPEDSLARGFQINRFKPEYLDPLLGDVLKADFHPLHGEISSSLRRLLLLRMEFQDCIGNIKLLQETPLYRDMRTLETFLDEFIDHRLHSPRGEPVVRHFQRGDTA